jgi:hypothetical protein
VRRWETAFKPYGRSVWREQPQRQRPIDGFVCNASGEERQAGNGVHEGMGAGVLRGRDAS